MKRYHELICKLLGWVEQQTDTEPKMPPEIEGYTPEQVHYHVGLCGQAGYLDVQELSKKGMYTIRSLTWEGHEFLAQKQGQKHSS